MSPIGHGLRFRRRRYRPAIAVALGAAVLTCAVAGAATATTGSKHATSSAAVQRGGTLTFAFDAGWDVLDPAATAFTYARQIMEFIYNPLLQRDPKTGAIVGGLATSWKFSNGNKTLTLALRHNVKFQDGTPFNAEAVIFSFKRILDPKTKSPYASTLTGPVKNFKANGDYTVVINLRTPFAPFLDSLTQINLAPVSPTAVKKYGADFAAHPVGTGPWAFQSQIANNTVTLVANPDYNWAPSYYRHNGAPYIGTLVFKDIPQAATRMALLNTGGVNVVYDPVPSQIPQYQSNPKFQVVNGVQPGMPRSVVLNTEMWPMTDPKVREAIGYAINKAEILKLAYANIGSVANNILTPNVFGYSAAVAKTWPTYDPAKAKAILAAAGYKPGDNGILEKDGKQLSFKMGDINPAQNFVIEDQIIQSDLKAIGIEISIEVEEQAAYLSDLRAGKWPMADMLFVATDPDVLYTILHSKSIGPAWNSAHLRNPQLDALLDAGRVETNSVKRAAIYAKAEALVKQLVPYVPYYNITNAFPMDSNIMNFGLDRQGFWDVYDTWIKT